MQVRCRPVRGALGVSAVGVLVDVVFAVDDGDNGAPIGFASELSAVREVDGLVEAEGLADEGFPPQPPLSAGSDVQQRSS